MISSFPVRPQGCQQRNRLFPLLLPFHLMFLFIFTISFAAESQLPAPESSLSPRILEFFITPSLPPFFLLFSFLYHWGFSGAIKLKDETPSRELEACSQLIGPPLDAAPQGQPLCGAHWCFQPPMAPGSSEGSCALQPRVGSVFSEV